MIVKASFKEISFYENVSIHNADISKLFRRLADLLEIEGANPFRIRAYRNAAQTIDDLPRCAAGMMDKGEDLTRLPAIGEDLASKINEISGTVGLRRLRKWKPARPPHLQPLPRSQALVRSAFTPCTRRWALRP